MGPNGLPSSVSHLFVRDVVSVGDAGKLSEASHLHGLYPSLCVQVQDSQAYRNIDMTRERISLIFELSAIFLSFQMVLSLASAAVAWAILARISGLDPSSAMIAPRYLNLFTQSSFSPLTLMSVLMPLVLLVISWVFSALICMPKAVEVLSRRSTKSASSSSLPARPSMSSAKRKFVIFLPPMLTVPSWSFSASVTILYKKMLNRVEESTQPCLTPTLVLNQSPMLLLR